MRIRDDPPFCQDGVALVSWRTRRSDGPEQDLRLARVSEAQGVLAQTT